jgi:hypothetical protein
MEIPNPFTKQKKKAFKGVRNEYILSKKSNNNGGKVAPYTSLLRQFLHSIVALVSVNILQIWADKVGDDLPANVASLALSLDFDEEPILKDPNNKSSKPDFVIRGGDPDGWGVSDPGKIIISTIDFKKLLKCQSNILQGKYVQGSIHLSSRRTS